MLGLGAPYGVGIEGDMLVVDGAVQQRGLKPVAHDQQSVHQQEARVDLGDWDGRAERRQPPR